MADANKAREAWDAAKDELQKAHNAWEDEKLAREGGCDKLTAKVAGMTTSSAEADNRSRDEQADNAERLGGSMTACPTKSAS